jgi:hypothetical protein
MTDEIDEIFENINNIKSEIKEDLRSFFKHFNNL